MTWRKNWKKKKNYFSLISGLFSFPQSKMLVIIIFFCFQRKLKLSKMPENGSQWLTSTYQPLALLPSVEPPWCEQKFSGFPSLLRLQIANLTAGKSQPLPGFLPYPTLQKLCSCISLQTLHRAENEPIPYCPVFPSYKGKADCSVFKPLL